MLRALAIIRMREMYVSCLGPFLANLTTHPSLQAKKPLFRSTEQKKMGLVVPEIPIRQKVSGAVISPGR